jgi:hypothetical protein
MNRTKIKPIVDVPMILEMESVVGQEANSPYTGLEYRYSVVHDRQPAFIYLPPEGRDALVRAHPQVGDLVELVMQKRGKQQFFRAQVLGDAQEPPANQVAPRPQRVPSNGNGYTNGHRQLAAAPQAAPAPTPQMPAQQAERYPIEELLVRCFDVAARVIKAGVAAAEKVGAPNDASFEDVRATAISLFIDRRKGGN